METTIANEIAKTPETVFNADLISVQSISSTSNNSVILFIASSLLSNLSVSSNNFPLRQ